MPFTVAVATIESWFKMQMQQLNCFKCNNRTMIKNASTTTDHLNVSATIWRSIEHWSEMQTQQLNHNLKCICNNWIILNTIQIQITFALIKLDALEVGLCRLKSSCSNWPLTSKMHYLHQYNYRLVFDDQLSFPIRGWYYNHGLNISFVS